MDRKTAIRRLFDKMLLTNDTFKTIIQTLEDYVPDNVDSLFQKTFIFCFAKIVEIEECVKFLKILGYSVKIDTPQRVNSVYVTVGWCDKVD